ncbi:MAG TPA: TIGR03749 family integrating conjugative element protein [Thiotrichales bacterium]|nr:TIGR03749 family integrating conjugative element protein [Thiotrichales bacterium]
MHLRFHRGGIRRLAPLLALLCLQAGTAGGEPPGTAHEQTPERIVWNKTPIRITLPVGSERMIHFPAAVRAGIPAHINAILRTQSVDGTLYLTASRPFDTARVMVRETESGQTYLLDLRAVSSGGSTRPVEIRTAGRQSAQTPPEAAGAARTGRSPGYGYVALTRFAARQLYAPRRLMRDLPGIMRTPVSRDPVALVRGGAVRAVPLIAWQSQGGACPGGCYVTAVRLTNITPRHQVLDPRGLRGRWLAATFQHGRLFPAGDEADTTTVYLISARPFGESLEAP